MRLARKKWHGTGDGVSNITAAEFDEVLGHSVAVTDAAASVFAAELIAAYPDAKVILNGRSDLDAWHESAVTNIAGTKENWVIYLVSRLTRSAFWSYTVYEDYLWKGLFRDDVSRGVRCNGKWIYKEHYNMVRGLVPKENLLEWCVEDGWEPLCKVNHVSVLTENVWLTSCSFWEKTNHLNHFRASMILLGLRSE